MFVVLTLLEISEDLVILGSHPHTGTRWGPPGLAPTASQGFQLAFLWDATSIGLFGL